MQMMHVHAKVAGVYRTTFKSPDFRYRRHFLEYSSNVLHWSLYYTYYAKVLQSLPIHFFEF